MCEQAAEKSISEGRDGPVSLLCSRNARSQKILVGRAQWETHPGHHGATYTSKLGMTIIVHSPAALLDKHFEHPAGTIP